MNFNGNEMINAYWISGFFYVQIKATGVGDLLAYLLDFKRWITLVISVRKKKRTEDEQGFVTNFMTYKHFKAFLNTILVVS